MNALLAIVVLFAAALPPKAFKVTQVPPVEVHLFTVGQGFVVGVDGIARTCPAPAKTYVRAEGPKALDVFQFIDAKTRLIPDGTYTYTLLCLKEE